MVKYLYSVNISEFVINELESRRTCYDRTKMLLLKWRIDAKSFEMRFVMPRFSLETILFDKDLDPSLSITHQKEIWESREHNFAKLPKGSRSQRILQQGTTRETCAQSKKKAKSLEGFWNFSPEDANLFRSRTLEKLCGSRQILLHFLLLISILHD